MDTKSLHGVYVSACACMYEVQIFLNCFAYNYIL